jgi:hypothetical protein
LIKEGKRDKAFAFRLSCVVFRRRYQPQQSVLKRQPGQRQTACIRYISAPHRSHSIFSF